MTTVIESLAALCELKPDREVKAHILTFRSGETTTTIRVVFDDRQSGAQMVITNMTTLPYSEQRKGFGSKALRALLECVHRFDIFHIQAVQVQRDSELFWVKNGFVKIGNITNDFRYSPSS